MQVTLSQSHLRRLARGFAKIAGSHGSHMPVLDCVRFRCLDGGNAEAAITNLDETLVLALPGCASGDSGPAEFLCPLAELRRLAKDLGGGDAAVLVPLAGGPPRLDIVLQVGGRDIRSRLDTIHTAEFPETLVPVSATVATDVGAFLDAFRTALPFASRDENRAILNSVFWHDEAHALVATDGRRLTKLRLDTLSLGQDIAVAPSKVLANGILDGGSGTLGVALAAERRYLDVACGPWHWQGRGPEGEYPNYGMVIPDDVGQFVATVEIAAADLPLVRSAISRLTDETAVAVHLCAVPGRPPLLVGSRADDDGNRVQVELPGSRCRTDALQVQAVNGRYLQECLEAGFLTLRLPADCTPWLCSGERPGLHCLMPMNEQNQDVAAFVAGRLNPGEQPMPPVSQNAPAVTTPTATAPAETATATAETTATGTPAAAPETGGTPAPQLSLVPSDPLQDLRSAVAETDEALRQATTAVRTLRERVRAVERSIRDREKQYARSEKVLDQLKLVAGF